MTREGGGGGPYSLRIKAMVSILYVLYRRSHYFQWKNSILSILKKRSHCFHKKCPGLLF